MQTPTIPDTPTTVLRRASNASKDGETPPYEDWPRGVLYERARSLIGRQAEDLNRAELIRVLRRAHGRRP